MPRSPVRSLRVRSSICSCTGRNQVRKEKKDGKKDNVTKNISNLNNKHEELGDFERDTDHEHIEQKLPTIYWQESTYISKYLSLQKWLSLKEANSLLEEGLAV